MSDSPQSNSPSRIVTSDDKDPRSRNQWAELTLDNRSAQDLVLKNAYLEYGHFYTKRMCIQSLSLV